MHSKGQQEDGEYAMLVSIVALLFALADDAEHAAGLPCAERYRLLWILRPAEAAARRLAFENAWYPDLCELPPEPSVLTDDSPAAALRLAQCFRAVGMMLACLSSIPCAEAHRQPAPPAAHLEIRTSRQDLTQSDPALFHERQKPPKRFGELQWRPGDMLPSPHLQMPLKNIQLSVFV